MKELKNSSSKESNVDQDLIDCIHDCLVELNGTKPNDTEILDIINKIPESIASIGIKWGYHDTVFGDKVYEWIRDRKL